MYVEQSLKEKLIKCKLYFRPEKIRWSLVEFICRRKVRAPQGRMVANGDWGRP